MCNYIFSTKVLKIYDNSASHQFCSRHSSHDVVCIIQIHMPCRLLVLQAPLYTNIVDRKSGPFGGNLDKNAKNWVEQGALAIFWRFLTPGKISDASTGHGSKLFIPFPFVTFYPHSQWPNARARQLIWLEFSLNGSNSVHGVLMKDNGSTESERFCSFRKSFVFFFQAKGKQEPRSTASYGGSSTVE